ncbi:hypothetical protein EJB05_42313, partial [Eragrostis curvula]
MAEGDCCEKLCGLCCVLALLIPIVALPVILIAAYADFDPVAVTVDEASLGRLALATPPAGAGSNDTTPARLAYNLSLAVAVRNPNWAIHVWRTAPLDAELRLGARPFSLVRLAGAEEEPEGRKELIRPKRSAVYRVVAAAEGEPLALGSDEQAEFAEESRAGLFRLELVINGEVKYQAHPRRRSFTVSCPLRLPLSTDTAAVAFARFEHTLPPQRCVYV